MKASGGTFVAVALILNVAWGARPAPVTPDSAGAPRTPKRLFEGRRRSTPEKRTQRSPERYGKSMPHSRQQSPPRSPPSTQPPSALTNVTRALVPLAPLIAEAPALAAHARSAWPWVRAAFPAFAFVSPVPAGPTPPAARLVLRRRHTRCHSSSSSSSSSSSRRVHASMEVSRSGLLFPDAVTRRAAMRQVVASALAGVVTVAVADGRAAAAAEAPPSGAPGGAERGRGGGEDGFGSKAFTEKSYDGFARGYDDLDGGWVASAIGMEDLRSQLLARATGRVLEVGVGTGLNLQHYRRAVVSDIDAVDLSPGMLSQASAKSESLGMAGITRLQQMDVEDLKFPSRTFDTVVDTFSLCVFSNPAAALREMARVCKPTGRVLLLENSKSNFGPLAAYQDMTASYLADKGGAKGCFWNQDVEALAREAGLRVERSSAALPGGVFRALECVPIL